MGPYTPSSGRPRSAAATCLPRSCTTTELGLPVREPSGNEGEPAGQQLALEIPSTSLRLLGSSSQVGRPAPTAGAALLVELEALAPGRRAALAGDGSSPFAGLAAFHDDFGRKAPVS